MHAPLNVTWHVCNEPVFHTPSWRDTSPYVNLGVLPQVIEATNRVLISNGEWDANVITNGTLLAIQNLTWNGAMGFQTAPSKDFIVSLRDQYPLTHLPQGLIGKQHYERGLQWVETYQSG